MKNKLIENVFFIIAGIGLIIYSATILIKVLSYVKIKAECIETYDKWFFTSDTTSKGYKSQFRFKYDGEEIIASESNYLDKKLKKNSLYTIFVNPRNPKEIISVYQVIANIVFFICGIIILFIAFLA